MMNKRKNNATETKETHLPYGFHFLWTKLQHVGGRVDVGRGKLNMSQPLLAHKHNNKQYIVGGRVVGAANIALIEGGGAKPIDNVTNEEIILPHCSLQPIYADKVSGSGDDKA